MKECDIHSIEKWSFQADICLLLVITKSIIVVEKDFSFWQKCYKYGMCCQGAVNVNQMANMCKYTTVALSSPLSRLEGVCKYGRRLLVPLCICFGGSGLDVQAVVEHHHRWVWNRSKHVNKMFYLSLRKDLWQQLYSFILYFLLFIYFIYFCPERRMIIRRTKLWNILAVFFFFFLPHGASDVALGLFFSFKKRRNISSRQRVIYRV